MVDEGAEAAKVGLSDIREVRETQRVPIDGYGLSLAASRGGKLIALGGMIPSQNGLIHLFEGTGKLLWRHKTREAISTVTICRTGDYMAAASDDNNLYCFDRMGLLQWRHETSRMIKCMVMSEGGDYLAAGGEDSNLYYFDKNRTIRKFAWKYRFEGPVTSVDISANGLSVAAGSSDRFAAFFDNAGELLWSHEAHDAISSVKMSQDGGVVALASLDHNVYCFSGTGVPVYKHDMGAPVTSLVMSFRGDTLVAAAGAELRCLDQHGVRLWSVLLPSPIIKLAASDAADCVLAATEDRSLYLVTRPGVIGWRYSSGGGIYSLALSDDRELGICCGPNELNTFENIKLFRELVSRHQGAITAAKSGGQDATTMEASYRQAISLLSIRSYPAIADSLKEVQDQLSQVERTSLEKDKQRSDAGEALVRIAQTLAELEAEGAKDEERPVLDKMNEGAKGAREAYDAGKYPEAMALIRGVEEAAAGLRKSREAGYEVRKQIEEVAARVQAAKGLEMDTRPAEADLAEARRKLNAGDRTGAAELARAAAGALLSAKASSPKAMEAEFERASTILGSQAAQEAELAQAEESLLNALALFVERREFSKVAESFELLASQWARLTRTAASQKGYENAMLMAVNAHRDDGNLNRAAALAKQSGDWCTAAKLLTMTGDKAGADEAWTKALSTKRPRPTIPDELKRKVEAHLSEGRFYDGAVELARQGFVLEATKVLAREKPDMRSAVLMVRLLFNLQDFGGILEKAKVYLAAMRRHAKETGNSLDLACYGHLLVGTYEMANLLEVPEGHLVLSELQEFSHEYTRGLARDVVSANDICDLTVLYTHLLDRNWKAVERLAELKGGPFWQHLKAAVAAWRDVNIFQYNEETKNLLLQLPGRMWYPTQTFPEVVSDLDPHEALAQLQPFNYPYIVHDLLDRLSNKEHLSSLAARADTELSVGREDRAINLYEKVLTADTFGLLESRKLNLRLAGIYLAQRKDSDALPHLEAAKATKEAAVAEYRSARGQVAPARRPATLVKPATPGALSTKRLCPGCAAQVPEHAIRCFRCGTALR